MDRPRLRLEAARPRGGAGVQRVLPPHVRGCRRHQLSARPRARGCFAANSRVRSDANAGVQLAARQAPRRPAVADDHHLAFSKRRRVPVRLLRRVAARGLRERRVGSVARPISRAPPHPRCITDGTRVRVAAQLAASQRRRRHRRRTDLDCDCRRCLGVHTSAHAHQPSINAVLHAQAHAHLHARSTADAHADAAFAHQGDAHSD
mmetsp:Transcript_22682/g.49568  ORF Transcript_22682/g.49568 Transcript_22682/m.49568 type:complete len:205 (+) Transcript_22682:285-899(+)